MTTATMTAHPFDLAKAHRWFAVEFNNLAWELYELPARTAEETDWDSIVLLYDALLQINPSPIVALNRAVAVGMAQGPAAGLDALDAAATLGGDSTLAGYHLFPSVRGDLLIKMGRLSEAREEIQRAIAMTKNLREQELLANRLRQLDKADFST